VGRRSHNGGPPRRDHRRLRLDCGDVSRRVAQTDRAKRLKERVAVTDLADRRMRRRRLIEFLLPTRRPDDGLSGSTWAVSATATLVGAACAFALGEWAWGLLLLAGGAWISREALLKWRAGNWWP
jgi:hypothetical protein